MMAPGRDRYRITIGFSTTKLFLSAVIRRITGSSCSHCFIAFDDSSLGMRMVMQAESWGYEIRPWRRWIRHNTLVAEFRPAGPSLGRALRDIGRRLGTKFDYRSALAIGIRSIFTSWYRNRFSLSPNRDPWKLTCSEAVIRFLQHGGYAAVKNMDPETTSPGDLLRAVLGSTREFTPLFLNKKYLKFDRRLKVGKSPHRS